MKITVPLSDIDKKISTKHVLVTNPDFDKTYWNFICVITSLQSSESEGKRFFYLDEQDWEKFITWEWYLYSLNNIHREHKWITTKELIKAIEAQRHKWYFSETLAEFNDEYKNNYLIYIDKNWKHVQNW